MKEKTKLLSCLIAAVIAGSALSVNVYAESDVRKKVRVIVENNTLSVSDGADWTGTLADEWVELHDDTTAKDAFLTVLNTNGFTQQGAEFDYITEINGLSAEDGGSMGGWMVSLDNWITDEAISSYTVSSGKLEGGDELRFSYSCNWGEDLGYRWSDADTSLSGVVLSEGTLTPDFAPDVTEYILTLPEETAEITIQPQTANKAYRAKVYLNQYTPAEKGSDYKLSEKISVTDGDVMIIGVANEAWMQSNYNNAQESIYTIHIDRKVNDADVKVQEAESLIEAIGEVTVQSGKAITAARNCYDALSAEQKENVSNAEKLFAAEAAFAALEKDHDTITPAKLREQYAKTANAEYVYGNEWDIINLCRFGLIDDTTKERYLQSVRKVLYEQGSEILSKTRSTVNSGVITALTACGADAEDFYGYHLLQPLSDDTYIHQQGINGAVYALIALDSHQYSVPIAEADAVQTTREGLVASILEAQETDGGWTIDTWTGVDDGSDADMTAMALQALAPYAKTNDEVKAAVDKALLFLSENQNEKGQFLSYGSFDCESSAQVLTALCALGIDIEQDEMFIKNGNTVYDGLMSFYDISEGGFSHYENGGYNAISTYQGYTAAAALYRMKNGSTSFFDMTDVSLTVYQNSEVSGEESTEISEINTEPSATDTEASVVSIAEPTDNVKTGDSAHSAVLMVCAMMLLSAAGMLIGRKRMKR